VPEQTDGRHQSARRKKQVRIAWVAGVVMLAVVGIVFVVESRKTDFEKKVTQIAHEHGFRFMSRTNMYAVMPATTINRVSYEEYHGHLTKMTELDKIADELEALCSTCSITKTFADYNGVSLFPNSACEHLKVAVKVPKNSSEPSVFEIYVSKNSRLVWFETTQR